MAPSGSAEKGARDQMQFCSLQSVEERPFPTGSVQWWHQKWEDNGTPGPEITGSAPKPKYSVQSYAWMLFSTCFHLFIQPSKELLLFCENDNDLGEKKKEREKTKMEKMEAEGLYEKIWRSTSTIYPIMLRRKMRPRDEMSFSRPHSDWAEAEVLSYLFICSLVLILLCQRFICEWEGGEFQGWAFQCWLNLSQFTSGSLSFPLW